MAFNLHKNGSPEGTSESNSKFDLSKNVAATGGTVVDRKRSNPLIYIVIGLLMVAGTALYLLSNRGVPIEKTGALSATSDTVETPAMSAKSTGAIDEVEKVVSAGSEKVSSQDEKAVNKIPAQFASGASSFNNLDKRIVNDIIAYLVNNSSARLEVFGYASSEGSVAVNQSISQARADAFKNYLIAKSVKADRIKAIGNGIANPIASNDTESGRRKNRRVEVRLN